MFSRYISNIRPHITSTSLNLEKVPQVLNTKTILKRSLIVVGGTTVLLVSTGAFLRVSIELVSIGHDFAENKISEIKKLRTK